MDDNVKSGMRGSGDFPPTQRPGSFGRGKPIATTGRVTRESTEATMKAMKKKGARGKSREESTKQEQGFYSRLKKKK